MADEVTTNGAASSAAAEKVNPFASGKLTKDIDRQFRAQASGEEAPEVSLQTEESATSTTKKEESSTSTPDKRPASETGKPTQEKKAKSSKEEIRLQELLDDLKEAGLSPAELKTFRKEGTKTAESSPAKTAEAKTAPKAAPVEELKAPVKPKWEDFENLGPDKAWEAFETAKDKYYEDCREYDRKKAVQDFKQEATKEAHTQQLDKELTAAREIYSDFDTVVAPAWKAIAEDKAIHPAVKEAVGASPVMTHLMYVIGGNKAQMEQFLTDAKTNPIKAIKQLGVMEDMVFQQLEKNKAGKSAKSEEKAEPEAKKDPATKKTEEPQPTREVGNRGTGPNDVAADEVRRSQGKLTKALSDTWTRKAAERQARG